MSGGTDEIQEIQGARAKNPYDNEAVKAFQEQQYAKMRERAGIADVNAQQGTQAPNAVGAPGGDAQANVDIDMQSSVSLSGVNTAQGTATPVNALVANLFAQPPAAAQPGPAAPQNAPDTVAAQSRSSAPAAAQAAAAAQQAPVEQAARPTDQVGAQVQRQTVMAAASPVVAARASTPTPNAPVGIQAQTASHTDNYELNVVGSATDGSGLIAANEVGTVTAGTASEGHSDGGSNGDSSRDPNSSQQQSR